MDFTVIAGLLLGGGFLGFLEFILKRYDSKNDQYTVIVKELACIRKDLQELSDRGDKREAVNNRVRILRFADELIEGKHHSKDSFDQVFSDITNYNQYCEEHPEFRNNQTVATVEHIEKIYKKCMEERSFL